MKKLYVLLFLALPLAARAQFNKGNIFLGGTLNTMLQNSDTKPAPGSVSTSTNNVFSIAPSFGYFLNEKMAVGAAVSYGTQRIEYSPVGGFTNKIQVNSIGVSPYLRFYQPITNSIYFGLQGGLSFSRGNTKQTTTNGVVQTVTETPTYMLSVNFRPLFIFFPSPKWGVEASIGSLSYSYQRTLPDAGSTTTFGLNAGSFSFGIAYYFIKK